MVSEIWIIGAVIIIAAYLIVKFGTFHENFAIKLLIFLFAFFILSMGYLVIKHDISLSSLDGLSKAVKLYVLWIGNLLGNVAKISGYALNQNWEGNLTTVG